MDEKVVVEYTPDKMLGIIWFEKPSEEGKVLSKDDIENAIEQRGIIYGIDHTVLDGVVQQRLHGYKYIIAKGKQPTKGTDARLEYKVDIDALYELKPKQNEDGTVDFKNLNIIQNIQEGQVLVVKTPATKGEDGCNIIGQAIGGQAGKDLIMPKGKNTEVMEDGVTLVATQKGKLCYDHQCISISDMFIVKGDVDSSTGNIEFVGSVLVIGNVKAGYTIKASGTIEVRGGVEAAEVVSGEDVIVWHGIQGKDKGIIKAGGNVIAKFIQNATVEAKKSIITEVIMHSHVAARAIKSEEGKGLIVGGTVVAVTSVSAQIIGSYMDTQTHIQIGMTTELLKQLAILKARRDEYLQDMEKIGQNITYVTQKRDVLVEQKQALLRSLLTNRQELEGKFKQIDQEYRDMLDKVNRVDKACVYVKNIVYPGVKITIGNAIKYIKEDTHYCTIQKDGSDLVVRAFA